MVAALALAIHTGNLFRYSKAISERFASLKRKLELTSQERQELQYYKINDAIYVLCRIVFGFGLLIFFVSFLVE